MSLTRRLLIAASLVLVALFGAVGLIVESAMRDGLEAQIRQRLESQVYALLAATELTASGDLRLPDELAEPRLNQPDSGLYAQVSGPGFSWQSPSTVGENPDLPATPLAPGEVEFLVRADIGPERAFVLRQGIAWEIGQERRFVVSVAEHERFFENQIGAFRLTLLGWSAAALGAFVILQFFLLRWSMAPLRRLGREIGQVEGGQAAAIEGVYPRELEVLTTALNAFIATERKNLERQRNQLADLAHSLKTPLAVLRSAAEVQAAGGSGMAEQIDRMDDIVAHQLRRARTSGRPTWARPIAIEPVAERIVAALERLHADRAIACEFDIEADIRFHGDEGDLAELLGNLLENAFKFARGRILFSAHRPDADGGPLCLAVDDDGPGVPRAQRQEILARGVRADERVPGHGVGLAVVTDLVDAYQGQLRVGESPELGGARFELTLR